MQEKLKVNFWQRVLHFLALKRYTALVLAALLLAGTGERIWIGFVPKYLLILGANAWIIGLFDGLQTLLGAVYAYPGGWLTDRLGVRHSLLLFSAISLVGYVLVLTWQHWLAVMLGAFFFVAWSALSLPTTFTVVATSLKANQHTMGIGIQSLVRRVPMAVGPLIGGVLINRFGWLDGIKYALLVCIFLTMLTMLVQWAMFEKDSRQNPQPMEAVPINYGFVQVVRSFTPVLRELLLSDILIRFCERLPYAWVIVWAMNHAGLSARQFGYLVAIEMITAALCYIPVAHFADKYGRRPFVLITFIFFTLFPLTLLPANNFGLLAVAFAIRGLKEFGEPARKALILNEAQSEIRSRTYGAYYLIRDCVVTTGSFLGAWLWNFSPQANFIGATVFGAFGTLWFWWFIYRKVDHGKDIGTQT